MIDFDKPVQTRDGRKVRILCTDLDGHGEFSVVAAIQSHGDPGEVISLQKMDGTKHPQSSRHDLVNVPETRVVFVNMYPKDSGCIGSPTRTRGQSDEDANNDEREACIRVEYEVGQFDAEPEDG